MSRHRQNFGAVGQVTRAMVVEFPLWATVISLRFASGRGCTQLPQSPALLNKLQPSADSVSWARSRVCWILSVKRGRSVRPSVATEIVFCARLIVTASSAGSRTISAATDRARQFPSGSFPALAGLLMLQELR
jgi:hypothetical protein